MQIHPIKSTLKVPGSNRLNLKYGQLVSVFAFNINLRRYMKASLVALGVKERAIADPTKVEAVEDKKAK